MPVDIASVSISLPFLMSNGIAKMVLKIMGKNKYRKIASLAKSKN